MFLGVDKNLQYRYTYTQDEHGARRKLCGKVYNMITETAKKATQDATKKPTTVKGIDFRQFSVKQLRDMIDVANKTLEQTETEARDAIKAKLIELAAAEGFDAEELFRKPRTVRPAKFHYRHPEDKAVVWRGKGKMPGWLRSLKDKGIDIEKLAFSPNE